ncbi:adenosylmethionine--8-amino-7-oxononanoate transaminase [Luteolibacter pohnpeiensis]|uniref:Adenosylmethionine-8-amino-7-oxononanoate aminotransferase n=1 Tax=Luteolibacter pohnpeiensis TaxID=454153 RepID=A0A934VRS4_9BACT|nr:adenosylmethionine--8-amino-7-oxononanoate transaminase [Luteolibacter pohnpeiensis]MBK1883521.1 adenosylmethionine--8-amino-7-oxononanoate transaminase [Luteolibacter pohnpeiensis]
MRQETRRCLELDRAHCWHPFTPQDDWCSTDFEPIAIARGQGVWLFDTENRRYFDGNSSIWTNIHGHAHPHITAAIQRQAETICHSSFLGYTHPLAAELAEKLTRLLPGQPMERVFFSDNGSTAIEVALKMALQYRQQTGEPERNGFIAFVNGYHGDTLGAASIGGVSRFFDRFRGPGHPLHQISSIEDLHQLPEEIVRSTAGLVIEPLIQGVNQMRPWPPGTLAELRRWSTANGIHLILDEVMTGFGRTGKMFACQHENVVPDFLCLAKGLTGGYLPLAATLTTQEIYDAFRGPAENAFYYGHSYTANPLGCAAALASLEVFESEKTLEMLQPKLATFSSRLEALGNQSPQIKEIRQVGLIAGIELHSHPTRSGKSVCQLAMKHGLSTRPILDTIVIMPPLCTTESELDFVFEALQSSLNESGH